MKTELSAIVKFGPALLFREDLIELEKILGDSTNHPNDKFEVLLGYNEQKFRSDSLARLLEQEGLPLASDELSIKRMGWITEDG